MAGQRQRAACVLLLAALCGAHFIDAATFTETIDISWVDRWTHSSADKYTGKFVAEAPPGLSDVALKVPEKARHYGIATAMPVTVDPAEGLVLQYDLKIADGVTCGGAYLKFLTADADVKFDELKDDSPYTIMFGPDKCGSTNKVHLILRHKSPLDGEIEEKHLKFPPAVLTDTDTHVYTAILHTNNTYDLLIDGESKKTGSLFDDFEPAFNPPAEIDDPEDKKPEEWVDTPKIPDPEAVKPEDWDEDAPIEIPDEEAVKPEGWLEEEPDQVDDAEAKQPEDWDEEEDGEWEPPRIPNPLCKDAPGCGEWRPPTKRNPDFKGKWTAPMIDNPEYKGEWAPAKIANPKYFKDDSPLAHIGKINAVAIEIWTMDSGVYFDNIVVANDPAVAAEFRDTTWAPKKAVEAAAAEVQAAKEAAEQAKAAEEATKPGLAESVNTQVEKLFDNFPFLEPVRPQVQKAVDALAANQWALYLALGLPAFLFFFAIFSAFKKKAPAKAIKAEVAKAKKEDRTISKDDASPSADAGDDEEEEDEGKASAARKRSSRPRRDT